MASTPTPASQPDDDTKSAKESYESTKSTTASKCSSNGSKKSNKSTASKISPTGSKRSTTTAKPDVSVPPAAAKADTKNWRSKAAEGIQSDALAIIASFILQMSFALFIMVEVISTTGRTLIYLVCVAVLILVSLFFIVEIIVHRAAPTLWLLVSGVYTAFAIIPAVVMLVISTKDNIELKGKPATEKNEYHIREEIQLKLVQVTTAITIIVMVCHLLAIAHFGIKHYNFGKKESKDLETGKKEKRATAGVERPLPALQDTKPPSKKPPMSYMIDAELQPVP